VFNTACATLLLNEPFTRYSVVGTTLVAVGAILIGIFGAMSEPSHNLDQLLYLLGQRQFIIWISGTFVIVAGVLVLIWLQESLGPRLTHRNRLILGLAYGSISGILSAHCLLLAKSAVELIVRTIVDKINQFNRWQSWMILVGLVILALSQLYYLHRGLKLCSTSVLYPFVFCIYNIIAILDGLIYFQQASRISSLHAGLIAIGTVILLGGVFALSWRLDPEYQAVSTAADTKAGARVATSHSALAPGMGLVETEEPLEITTDSHFLRPGDEEDVLNHAHRAHFGPSESTPLLRTQTSPSPWRRMSKNPKNGSMFRPPRIRRLTVPDDTTEIWDELNNDSNESRRFSGAFSPQTQLSPSHSKMLRRHQRTSTGGSSMRGRSRPPRNLFGTFGGSMKWPTWDKGKRPLDLSQDVAPPIMDSGDDTDEADIAGTVRRNKSWRNYNGTQRSRSEGNLPQTETGGWFKLKWWKRRWRGDEEGGHVDG
jgi:hypothetical protein